MSKHRVLLVSTNFWPEPAGISVYATDVAKHLSGNGFDVTVLTGVPHYPWWHTPKEYLNLTEGTSVHENIQVIRGKHFIPRIFSVIQRIKFEISLWWNLSRVYNRTNSSHFDAVIAFTPTVAAGLIGKNVGRKLNIPFGVIVQDLSGLSAIQSGLKGGMLISGTVKSIENKVLSAADSVVVISPEMEEVLTLGKIDPTKVSMILNYTVGNIVKQNKDESKRYMGWKEEDFIVVHAGNMGAKQDLENVIEAAEYLLPETRIRIFIVGHGNQESKLKDKSNGKANITILPGVSDADFSTLLSAADLLLVNERNTQIDMSLPSKLTTYLCSNRPVLAAIAPGGATWRYLEGIAELVEAGKPRDLAIAIKKLASDPSLCDSMALRGEDFALANLRPEIGRKKYQDWVTRLISDK